MAREMVYEGPDLQQLLQRVIDERGPARIRPPEKRRKGGLLGFFAREVFVITVDDNDRAAGATTGIQVPPAPVLPMQTPSAQAPPAQASPVRASPTQVPPAQAVAGASTRATGDTLALRTRTPRASSLSSRRDVVSSPLRALVEATEDVAELTTAGGAGRARGSESGPANRTPGGTAANPPSGRRVVHPPGVPLKPFNEVLSEVASSLGEEPGTYRADPEKLRGLRRPAPPAPPPAQSAAQSAAPPAQPAAPAPAPLPAQLTLLELQEDVAPAARCAVPDAEPVSDIEAVQIEVPRAQPSAGPTGESTDVRAPDLDAAIVELLRAAGFPDGLLPRAPLDPSLPTIEAIFASLPTPPPLPADPGGLVVVVGPAGTLRSLACAVAYAVGCPEDEVAVASPGASDRHAQPGLRARTAAQASAMHAGWRRDKVAVVAVHAPPLGTDQTWTREVLHALRPSCVWGMADATTKPDDVRRWANAIGGLDALVVTGVDTTATPASILSLEIPVACLNDDPATPRRWATLVADLVARG